MKLVAISIVSWLVGLAAYAIALEVFWHESLQGGDLTAVLFWSAVASIVCISVVYAPIMFGLKNWLAARPAWWPFPLAGVALGVFPVMLVGAMFGGDLHSLYSPEAMLFCCMFVAFGLVFGVGFFLAYGRGAV